jgi:hypothetical protein
MPARKQNPLGNTLAKPAAPAKVDRRMKGELHIDPSLLDCAFITPDFPPCSSVGDAIRRILTLPIDSRFEPRNRMEALAWIQIDGMMSKDKYCMTEVMDRSEGKAGRAMVLKSTGDDIQATLADTEKRWLAEATEQSMLEGQQKSPAESEMV